MTDYMTAARAKLATIEARSRKPEPGQPVWPKINPEQESELMKLYRESEASFSEAWILGVYDALDKMDAPLAAQIDRARDILDATWIKVRAGTAGIEDFKMALNEWKDAHIRGLARVGAVKGEQLALKMVNQ